jgi:hypothetical protein
LAGQTLKAIDFLVARQPWCLQDLEKGLLCLEDFHGKEPTEIEQTLFISSVDAIIAIDVNLEVIIN